MWTFDEDFNTIFQNSIFFFKLLAKLQWNGSQNNTPSTGSLQYGLIAVDQNPSLGTVLI